MNALNTSRFDSCLEIYSFSDIGTGRRSNQDTVGAYEKLNLAIIADGVGGSLSGHIASKIAVDQLYHKIRADLAFLIPGRKDKRLGVHQPASLLKRRIEEINNIIYNDGLDEPHYYGMSSTIVAMLLVDGVVNIAHIGDSRAYLWRKSVLTQLTTDHTLDQHLQRKSKRGSGKSKKKSSVLTKALGSQIDIECAVWEGKAEVDDILILSTDGLHGFLSNEDIENTINEYNDDFKGLAGVLVSDAKIAGSTDNISVVLAKIKDLPRSNLKFFSRIFNLIN